MNTDGTWRIDPRTTVVRLRARALGIPATCEISIIDATATVAGDGCTGAIRATFDTASFRSGNDRRDAHVKSQDFLSADIHPIITFDATWVDLPTAPALLTGEVRLGEASAPATLKLTAREFSDGTIGFSANARISRRRLGLNKARLILSDRVDVSIQGVATLIVRSHPEAIRETIR